MFSCFRFEREFVWFSALTEREKESNENVRKLFACIFWLSLLCKARSFSDKTAILNCSVFGEILWVPTSQRMRSVIFFSKQNPRWPSCKNKGLPKFFSLDPCFHENSTGTSRLKHIVVKLFLFEVMHKYNVLKMHAENSDVCVNFLTCNRFYGPFPNCSNRD